jgi:hypothetical protein
MHRLRTQKERGDPMRLVLSALCTVVLCLPAFAAERKVAAAQVKGLGVVAYDVDESSEGMVRLRLVREGSEALPSYELLTLKNRDGGEDTDVMFEPAVGAPVSIEWTITQGRMTLRQGDATTTVFWDDAAAAWARERSLFGRRRMVS